MSHVANYTDEDYNNLLEVVISVLNLKKEVFAQLLVGEIIIHISPTFINHMLNEITDFLLTLSQYLEFDFEQLSKEYNLQPLPTRDETLLNHHLWLLDAEGHIAILQNRLDPIEKESFKRSKKLRKKLKGLFIRAMEFIGYQRATQSFPALEELDILSMESIREMIELLEECERKVKNKEKLGTIMPLLVDHMIREEAYYLAKILGSGGLEAVKIDPRRERKYDPLKDNLNRMQI